MSEQLNLEIQAAKVTSKLVELSDVEQKELLQSLKEKEPRLHALVCRMVAASDAADIAFDIKSSRTFYENLASDAAGLGVDHSFPDLITSKKILELEDGSSYKIVRELGRGSMGCVFLADQVEPFHRPVAIKLFKYNSFGLFNSYFCDEIQALALINHSNVCRIYAAGEIDNNSYFIMEYINGPTVTKYAGLSSYSLHQRLELALQICDGVANAHETGLIHGDLKPENILVSLTGIEPTVKVIDFGIAQAISRGSKKTHIKDKLLTFGTIGYMAPEQLQGGTVSVKSDIYALGVVFWELFTDKKFVDFPCSQNMSQEEKKALALRSVIGSLEALSKHQHLNRELSKYHNRDLLAFMFKMLDPNFENRYDSVPQVREDLKRFLEKKPLSIRPDSISYRMSKLIQRNPLGSFLTTIFLIFVGISSLRMLNDHRTALENLERLESTYAYYDEILSELNFLRNGPQTPISKLIDVIEQQLKTPGVDPRLRYQGHKLLGSIHFSFEQYEQADAHFQKGKQLAQELFDPPSLELLEMESNLIKTTYQLGAPKIAIEKGVRIRRFAQKNYGKQHSIFAHITLSLAFATYHGKSFDSCLDYIEDVLSSGLDPRDSLMLSALNLKAAALRRLNHFNDALLIYDLLIERQILVYGRQNPRTMRSLYGKAVTAFRLKNFSLASELYAEVARYRDRTLGPKHPSSHRAHSSLILSLKEMGQFETALKSCDELIQNTLETPFRKMNLKARRQRANILQLAGRKTEALAAYEQLYDIYLRDGNMDSPDFFRILSNLGGLLLEMERIEAAMPYLERSWQESKCSDPLSRQRIYTQINFAAGLQSSHAYEDALYYFQEAWFLAESTYSEDENLLITCQAHFAAACLQMGDRALGEDLLLNSLDHATPGSEIHSKIEKWLNQ